MITHIRHIQPKYILCTELVIATSEKIKRDREWKKPNLRLLLHSAQILCVFHIILSILGKTFMSIVILKSFVWSILFWNSVFCSIPTMLLFYAVYLCDWISLLFPFRRYPLFLCHFSHRSLSIRLSSYNSLDFCWLARLLAISNRPNTINKMNVIRRGRRIIVENAIKQ